MVIRLLPLAASVSLVLLVAPPAAAKEPFQRCQHGGSGDCVVDGDTFWMSGEKIRIADIDTPEIHQPRCMAEYEQGERAAQRLLTLLNAGAFSLEPVAREKDRYGRTLRVVNRRGRSVGAMLVAEGLARPWTGSRQPWCRS